MDRLDTQIEQVTQNLDRLVDLMIQGRQEHQDRLQRHDDMIERLDNLISNLIRRPYEPS